MRGPRLLHHEGLAVAGIATRTTDRAESVNASARVPLLWERFHREAVARKIARPVSPSTVVALYTGHKDNGKDGFTLTLGCPVEETVPLPDGLEMRRVPGGHYAVFTAGPGPLPQIVAHAWAAIAAMSPQTLGGRRRFSGDFELYGPASRNPRQAEVEIWIALE